MNSRKLFSFIRKFNIMLIFFVGILSLGLLTIVASFVLQERMSTKHVNNVSNVAGEEVKKLKVEIGDFARIEGSQVFRSPISVKQEYSFSYGSKEASSIRNYLFFNQENKSTYWLKNGNDALILSADYLPESNYNWTQRTIVAFVYVIVEKDTNSDERFTENDLKNIAISDANGLRYKVILKNVNRLNGLSLLENGHILIFYSTVSAVKVAEVDLQLQQILSDVEMTILNDRKK